MELLSKDLQDELSSKDQQELLFRDLEQELSAKGPPEEFPAKEMLEKPR